MALATLSIDLTAKTATFEKDLQRTVKMVESSAGQMNSAFSLVKTGLAGLASAFTADFFVNYVRGAINGIDALNDLKDATGASIEKISALEDIALRSGNSFEAMAGSLTKFNKVLTEAKPGSDMERTLASIGLSAKELRDLDPADALLKTAQALAGYADDGNKARLVQDLFGKSIREAGPWLKDLAEAGKLNATVTTQQAEEAERFNKELANLAKNSTDTARAIVGSLIPAMNGLFEAFRTGGLSGAVSKGLDNYWSGVKKFWGVQNSAPEGTWSDPNASFDALEAQRLSKNRKSAPAPYSKPTGGGGGRRAAAQRIDANAQALASYVKQLENATEKTQDLTEVEKANQFLTSIGKTGQIEQVRELVLGMATRIDQEKELTELLKLKRIAAAAAGDEINKENEKLAALVAATPSAQNAARQADVGKLAGAFSSGYFGDPASAEAVAQYAETVKTVMGTVGDASKELSNGFESLGATFASAFEDAVVGGKKFSEVLSGLEQDIIRIVTRKLVTEPLGNALTGFIGDAFKSGGIGGLLSSLFSFDGGGYTGAGSRSGGLDGRGGFMALLHPNETVTDHTRGSGGRGARAGNTVNLTVHQNFPAGTSRATTLQAAADARRQLEYAGRNL